MPAFLRYDFMIRALLAGLMVGAVCPAIGVFLVPRHLSLIADTLSHVALAGVALGLLLGISPVLGALVVTVAAAVGIERLRAAGRLSGEAALAVFLAGGFGLAVVLISLGGGFSVDLFSVLFGSITTVSPTDLWVILAVGAVVGLAITVFYKELFAVTLDEEAARVGGIPVDGLNLMLTVLTALVIVTAMRVVGILLVSALIVLPTLAALRVARSFRTVLGLAVGFAEAAVVVGLVAAFYLDIAAGGAIVLTSLGLFGSVWTWRRLRGAQG